MTTVPKLNSLKKLDLSQNQIEELSNPGQIVFRDVAYFDISGNSLRLLSHDAFSFFPNLEEIHLENNKIMSVDWEVFRLFKLRTLYLQNNYLPVISEHMLRFTPNLEILNLSNNQLTIVQSSSFYNAQRLSVINLSHNRIQKFKYDSFSTLNQVSSLDLSYNNFSILPGLDLKQIVGLKTLNLTGNPFDKLVAGDISLPILEELQINDCPKLRLIEAGSFSTLPKLKKLSISNNPKLSYISPNAFKNISQLDEIVLKNNSLQNIDGIIFNGTKKLFISGNPLECNCINEVLLKFSKVLQDKNELNCKEKSEKKCKSEPFLPFGNSLEANLGSCFSIYCSSTTFSPDVLWTLSNGSQVVGNQSEDSWSRIATKSDIFLPFLSNIEVKNEQNKIKNINENTPRVTVTSEQLKFEAVLPEDAGKYKCSIGSGKSVDINLKLKSPTIKLIPVEVGSHFVTVSWNASLKICAYNRVGSFLTVQDADGVTRRYTRLSLHNPWLSYNVMRLKPLQNYTICLLYVFTEGVQNRNIYENCITIKTTDTVAFWNSLNLGALLVILGIPFSVWIIVLIRTIYYKLHIWRDSTIRAKMNQSISGQSFLSRSSSTHDHVLSPSSIFENNSERTVQSTRMSVLGPLIEEPNGYSLEYENNAAV